MIRILASTRRIAVVVVSLLLSVQLAPSIALACEGGGEEGIVDFNYKPTELKWASKETTSKKLEIILISGSDPVKLLSQKTTDETDFEPKDPNKCFGKSFVSPCSVEIRRKTTTVTGLKFWEFEYEDETTHATINRPKAVDLEGN